MSQIRYLLHPDALARLEALKDSLDHAVPKRRRKSRGSFRAYESAPPAKSDPYGIS